MISKRGSGEIYLFFVKCKQINNKEHTQAAADEHLSNLGEAQSEQVHQGEVGSHRQDEGVHLQSLQMVCITASLISIHESSGAPR